MGILYRYHLLCEYVGLLCHDISFPQVNSNNIAQYCPLAYFGLRTVKNIKCSPLTVFINVSLFFKNYFYENIRT